MQEPYRVLPAWLLKTLGYTVAALSVAALCWLVGTVLLRVALVSFTIAIALLVTALMWPLFIRLHGVGVPRGLAALAALLLLLGVPVGVGLLLWNRVGKQVRDLTATVTAGIDEVRSWLTTGPLSLDPAQLDSIREQAVGYIRQAVPSPVSGAQTVLYVLSAFALALFTVFFLLKDGPAMWTWLLERVSATHRARVDDVGNQAWITLTRYVAGVTLIALVDAVLIGAGLFVLGVPLALSLTLLVFLGAFVPILGATVSGAVAVLVTLVTNGFGDAVVILAVVLVVQQLEGNILQPLVVGRAVNLHPVVTLVAVTCGSLLLGIPGAVLAVPLVAVCYRGAERLRQTRALDSERQELDEQRGP